MTWKSSDGANAGRPIWVNLLMRPGTMYGHFLRCTIHNDTIINGTVAVLLLHEKIDVTVKIHIFTGFL